LKKKKGGRDQGLPEEGTNHAVAISDFKRKKGLRGRGGRGDEAALSKGTATAQLGLNLAGGKRRTRQEVGMLSVASMFQNPVVFGIGRR